LLSEIQNKFSDYLCYSWYDTNDNVIRLICNAGYIISFNSSVSDIITIKTFLNNYNTVEQLTKTNYYYAYGYLELYTNDKIYSCVYPTNSLNNSLLGVTFNEMNETNSSYALNATLNLSYFWSCKFENLFGLCIRYDRCSTNTIYATIYYSWAYLLQQLVNQIDFVCDNYDAWRRKNIINTIETLVNMLDKISVIVENEKDQFGVIKKDYCEYAKDTNNCYVRIY
jgi:hypothetical protein